MDKNNKDKNDFLGMPFGTATGRLRKMILFSLLQRHNENVCFQCKQEISSIEELSIEHIKPWQNVSVELYWDLDNIAFSHISCNVRATRRTPFWESHKHLRTPEGSRICRECGTVEGPEVKFRPEEYLCNKCAWLHRMGQKQYTRS